MEKHIISITKEELNRLKIDEVVTLENLDFTDGQPLAIGKSMTIMDTDPFGWLLINDWTISNLEKGKQVPVVFQNSKGDVEVVMELQR